MMMTRNRVTGLKSAMPARAASVAVSESLSVAASYDAHPLLAGNYFYLLPAELLTQVVRQVGQHRFDDKLVEMELALAQSRDENSSIIGRSRGEWISYEFFAPQINHQVAASTDGTYSHLDTSRLVRPFALNY